MDDITWPCGDTEFLVECRKIFQEGMKQTSKIFLNTRREILYLQVAISLSFFKWLFHLHSLPTFLWKLPPKKPQFNDICVLFKHSNFLHQNAGKIMHPNKRPRFQIFSRGHVPGPSLVTCAFSARKLHLWCEFFPSPPTLKLLPPT